jgi:BA14K-like protein
MQFLVYLTVLMVSISTVLLEVHWLTSPAPQPKPAVQAANVTTATPRKVAGPTQIEGPSPALSPVYPKPEDATPAATASATQSQGQQPPQKTEAQPTTPQQAQASASPVSTPATGAATPEPPKAAVETTGVASRTEEKENRQAPPVTPVQATESNNRCDVQACSSAYQSFRASDCTYQPFEGPRRICEKAPGQQRTARDQSERPERRQWSRDVSSRDNDRTVGRRVYDEDADEIYAEDDDGPPRFSFFGFGGRRRW